MNWGSKPHDNKISRSVKGSEVWNTLLKTELTWKKRAM